ncbi:Outer-membrane lipoprotein LolB [Candidatus Ecksteinia adelgidicola]|nr:Outer-membrane lipoprotein LolB [Candidatus Ecksteinia adelgidicola]
MFTYKKQLFQLIVIISLLLPACTITKPIDFTTRAFRTNKIISTQWLHHKKRIQSIIQYKISGSFACISNKKRIYAHFFLEQFSKQHYHLLFTDLFGFTQLDISVLPKIIEWTNSKGKHYYGHNPEKIIKKLSGMDIPLYNLNEWILGLAGNAQKFILNHNHYLNQLIYKSNNVTWTINYLDYHYVNKFLLPRTIELKQGNNIIKLKINHWAFN